MRKSTSFWQRHRSRIVGSLGFIISSLYLFKDYLVYGPNLADHLSQKISHDIWLYSGLLALIPISITLGVIIQRAERERERLQTLFEAANDGIYLRDADGTMKFVNSKFLEIHGLREEDVIGQRSLELLAITPEERQRMAKEIRQAILRGEQPPMSEAPFRRPDGTIGWIQINVAFLKEANQVREVMGIIRDITERKRLETILARQNNILEQLALGAPLAQVLEQLCRAVEENLPGSLCSVLLLDGLRLRHSAAPSLPDSYNQAVDGLAIGPNAGSCGTAVYRKELVVVSDTLQDPLWAPYRDLARQYRLRACWSMPVLSTDGSVLGTFAVYHRQPHSPGPPELQIIARASHLATIAIEHEQSKSALRASEQRYRLLFERNLAGIFRSTLDGRILDCNEALARILGYDSTDDLKQHRSVETYFDPAEREALLTQLQRQRRLTNLELRLRRKDGSAVWVLENVNLVENEREGPVLQGVMMDITEQKRAAEVLQRSQEQLRASEERYRDLVEHANDAIYTLDNYGRFTSFNRKGEEITGYRLSEVLGRSYMTLVRGSERRKIRRAFIKNLRGELNIAEVTVTRKDGQTAILEMSSRPIWRAGHVSGVQGIARDITEKKALERLQQEFVSTVSHELRTPLTSIKGYVDLILAGDTGPLSPEQEEFLNIVSQNTTRLTMLINDLLDIQKLEAGRVEFEFEELKLNELLPELAQGMRVSAEQKKLRFHVELEPQLIVRGDRERLAQVFNNLLSNAIKYTPEGEVALRARKLGNSVTVSVSDTGIGLSEKDLQKLFHKFYRSDHPYVRKVGGTGLGLAITKTILDRHSGKIEVASQLGQGSTFTVWLPALVPSDVTAPHPTVLVIEDELEIAKLIAKYIKKLGYHAETACTAHEGLEKALKLKPQLITLDVLMPDMDGFTLIRKLKSHPETAPIPVIFLSIVQDRLQGLRLGASAYLTKPIDERKFADTVRSLLEPQGQPVLVVDDDQDFAKLLQRLLQREGWSAEIAGDGEEALEKLRTKPYQLVLLDKHMPKRSGLEVLQELRNQKALAHVPVILISGTEQAEKMAQSAEILGARKFLSKKLSPQTLVQEIVRFLEEHRLPPSPFKGEGTG